MILPFSRTEFLQVFAAYNAAIWPMQFVAAGLGLLAVMLLFRRPKWADRAIAAVLVAYSFVGYPLLGLLLTHPYPETPLFGVAPCPTTIFTLGLLLLVRHPRPWVLALVPLLWSVIGGERRVPPGRSAGLRSHRGGDPLGS